MNLNGISIGHGIMFGQVGYLLGGLFLIFIGLAVLYTLLYWRVRALQLEGEIIGVRQAGPYFHSVFRFVMPDGSTKEATSVQGSSSQRGRTTGRRVAISVMPNQPDEVREAMSPTIWALAIGSLAGGVWLSRFALTAWTPTFWMWLVLGAVVFYLGSRVSHLLRSRSPAKAAMPISSENRWAAVPIRPAEGLHSQPRVAVTGTSPRRTGIIFSVMGLAIIAFTYVPAHRLLQLRAGARATGVVTALETNTGNNSDSGFYPRVQFTGQDGAMVRFVDRTGSNPASYKVGEQVTVLYRPEDLSSATIDRGLRNWEPVVMLLLLGSISTAMGASSLRST
jgi:hypothetical protein